MQTTRTFVAASVPDALESKLTRLQSLVASTVPDVRWSTVLPFHVTLAFLGDVRNTDLNAVCLAVNAGVKRIGPLELRIERLGLFGSPERPRTLWVGLGGGQIAALADLRTAVAAAAAAAGYPSGEEAFEPHITLGRFPRRFPHASELSAALNHFRTWSAGSFTLREVVTFASTLTPQGPVYAPLARAPLGAGKAQGPA